MTYEGISRQQIVELTKAAADPAISIYVAAPRNGPDVQHGRIQLKNFLIQAEKQLVERGMRHTLAIDLLAKARELDYDAEFWKNRLESVAMFIAEGTFETFHLPFAVPDLLVVNERFLVRPLLSVLTRCLSYYVLAAEKGHVRLVHCSPLGTDNLNVENMPESLEGYFASHHSEKQSDSHTGGHAGGGSSMIHHGSGDKGLDEKAHVHHFCQAVARSVEHVLVDSAEPVVLVGTDDIQAAFRDVSRLKHLLPTGIVRSPKMMDNHALHTESAAIVDAFADTGRQTAIAHYKECAGTGLTSQQIDSIIGFATKGQVDVLFDLHGEAVWGTYNEATDKTSVHESPEAGDEELINLALISTIQSGGTVYSVRPEELELTGPVGVILRY